MKNVLIIISLIGLIGCNSPQKKSIFEPLTLDELKTFIKKDTIFEYGYKRIQYIRDTVLKTDIDRVKWADLTYGRINKYLKFAVDSTYFKPLEKQFKSDWNEKFGQYLPKVDSISDYWKKYKTENSLNNYVKIELVEIHKKNYEYIGGIENIDLGFRLTPLKGPIEQLRFGYKIEAKIDETSEQSEFAGLLSRLDYSWCKKSDPFSRPTVSYWEVNYKNEKLLEYRDLPTIKRDYNILIEVDEIRKDGKNLSTDDLKIPKSVEYYWENQNFEFLKELYIKDIVLEFLNKNYKTEFEYVNQKTDSILKKKDDLCFNFFRIPTDELTK